MFRPSFANFFRKIFGRKIGTIVKRRPTRRFHVELLEDRVTPSTVVTTTMDVVDNADGFTSLREAVMFANTNPGDDIITFDGTLTSSGPATVLLSQVGDYSFGPSALNITSNITIQGPTGSNGINIARDAEASPDRLRLFIVQSGAELTLESLTLTNGLAKGGDGSSGIGLGGGGGAAGFGGAIVNQGTLNILHSTLAGNVAQGGAGGSVDFTGYAGSGGGGGLGGSGGAGGGEFANSAGGGGGGGVAGPGQSSNNGARGGLNTLGEQADPNTNGTSGGGGGGHLGYLSGPGGAGSFGGGGGGGYFANPGAGGFGGGGGGGTYEAGGTGGFGGGAGGDFSGAALGGFGGGNSNGDGSGVVGLIGGGGAGMGGAIFNYDGVIRIYNSTLANNSAIGGWGGNNGQGLGGAIFSYDGTILLTNSTLAANTANQGGGAIQYHRVSTGLANVHLANSILADSIGPDDFASNVAVSGNLSHCIVESTSLDLGAGILAADPILSDLADNGGPTQTMSLLSGSPAINAGDNDDALDFDDNPLTTDQRGPTFDRIIDGTVDMGAFEYVAAPSIVVTTAQDVVNAGDGLTSLREAITIANSNADVSAITFGDGSAISGGTDFTDATPDTLLLSGGQMTLTESATITGPGANRLTIDADQLSRVFQIQANKTATVAGMTLTNGLSGGGGAILNFGTLTVLDCWIHSNTATVPGFGGHGGGIKSLGSLTVIGSTVNNNVSDNAGGGINVGDGGFDGSSHLYFLTLINSTITGNSSLNTGGVDLANATLTMTNTTIFGNSAATGADLGLFVTDVTAKNSAVYAIRQDTSPITDAGGNLFGVYPELAPLGNYGGTMPTMIPLPGSPALDAGDDSVLSGPDALTTDQRGFNRSFGAHVDVGAVESRGYTLTLVSGDDQSTPVTTAFAVPLKVSIAETGGAPIPGVLFNFSAGTSAGGATATVPETATTDANGEASATATANEIAGSYAVTADRTGLATTTFNLTNFIPPETPSLVVTTALDVVDNTDGLTSLREALAYAVTLPESDTITFGDGSAITSGTNFTDGTPDTITGSFEILSDTTITAPGASRLTISGHAFYVDFGVTAEISGLTISNGNAEIGGGIRNNGNLTVRQSTFTNNFAGAGGAIESSGTLFVSQSTFSGNTAIYIIGGNAGGGIFIYAGTAVISQSTFTGNSSGINLRSGSTLTISNSILAGNTVDFAGVPVTQAFNNLVGDPSSAGGIVHGTNGNIVGKDDGAGGRMLLPIAEVLSELADNGGPTQTHALVAGSPALDAGDNARATSDGQIGSTALAYDQRGTGFDRIGNGVVVDIGAFELQLDFGDAPTGYAVTLAENGARHIATGPTLGEDRTAEADGTHHADADADEGDDGVDPHGAFIAGQTTNVTFNVHGGSGFLNAWVDLNHDLAWTADEQFFTNVPLNEGDNVIPFAIPAEVQPGYYVVRARLTSASVASPSPTGLLPDGEVEDSIARIREAQSLVVTTANDVYDRYDGLTSLGEALDYAEDHSGSDEITFGDGSAISGGTNFTDATPDTITLDGNELGIDLDDTGDVRITGPGADKLTISGNDESRIFYVEGTESTTLTLTGLTLAHGKAFSDGAAIEADARLVIVNCVLSNNNAEEGGAIWFSGEYASFIVDSVFHDNSSDSDGGAIRTSGDATLTVLGSTFFHNHAGDEGGVIDNNATVYFINSTLASNSADTEGGAINNQGTLYVINSTIVGNRADSDGDAELEGGGIRTDDYRGLAFLFNSIIAGNRSGAVDEDLPSDLSETNEGAEGVDPTSANNIIGDAATAANLIDGTNDNIVGALISSIFVTDVDGNPLLADNGGPTMTIALRADSIAINQGNNALSNDQEGDPLEFDQRGDSFDRTVGGTVDIGAFEVPPAPVSLDFGDAPTGYPVTLAENGARHVAAGPTLGATRTSEADGAHSASADGDADDDGITAAGPLVVGQTTNITINVQGGSGFVNAWADLNRDGDFNDLGEQFLTNFAVTVGDNVIPFAIPANFTAGQTVSRYRLTSASVASTNPAGLLPDGEVEDYVGTIVTEDFGDAPTGYPTTRTENGARHIATGPTLGATRTSEADGTHSATASADTGDDGVTAAGPLVVGQTTNITINVQGGSGFVNAWADLNRDGDFNDLGEQFLTNFAVSVGDNVIPFAIPSNFTPGQIVSRYRLTSASVASPSPAGLLPDGEVEDYVGTIYPAVNITTTTVSNWTVNRPGYSQTIAVTGGTGTRSFSVLDGALPVGLTLNTATGAITGTPTVAAASTFTIKVTDVVGAVATRQFTVTINAIPSVGNLTQTVWTNGAAGFTGTQPITGGTSAFVINSITGLPTGLTAVISGSRIAFSGAPNVSITAPRIFNCRVTVKDAAGAISALKTFAITINPAIQFNITTLPTFTLNTAYAQTITTRGGTGLVNVSYTLSGPLPVGLTIKPASPTSRAIVISGKPTGTGSVIITLTAVDSVGAITRITLTLANSVNGRRRGA